jgi:hypothetical protein
MLSDEKAEHSRMIVRLEPLDLKMMLGLAVPIESEIIGELHVTSHFLQEPLIQLGPLSCHSGFNLFPAPYDSGLHQMELHDPVLRPPGLASAVTLAILGK